MLNTNNSFSVASKVSQGIIDICFLLLLDIETLVGLYGSANSINNSIYDNIANFSEDKEIERKRKIKENKTGNLAKKTKSQTESKM
jgi:hypothetical protein